MIFEIQLDRRKAQDAQGRRECFRYETADLSETIATVLSKLNSSSPLTDTDGNAAEPIRWECSCLQRKCGACAMLINHKPRLACDARLEEYAAAGKRFGIRRTKGKKEKKEQEQPVSILLEPLKKFPLVEDLITDRGIMQENLRKMNLWLSSEAVHTQRSFDTAYEASRCLQCGLCLEVCPNYSPENGFTGLAAAVPSARVLVETASDPSSAALKKKYRKYVYEGCGKSLACRNICPAGIDADGLLASSSAIAVWGRRSVR